MTINLKIPASWNALNDRQLKELAKVCHAKHSGVVLEYKLFIILLDIRFWELKKRWKAVKTIGQVGFSTLKQSYNWLNNELNVTRFISKLRVNGQNLYAPSQRITNLTVNEFAHADDLYLGWHNTKDFEYLQYLAAVLYREKDASGKRPIFDKTELELRAKKLSRLNTKTLLAIGLSYQGCRLYLVSQFPLVFPKSTQQKRTPRNSGFGKLVLHLSGGKFGTHNETKNTNVYTFLEDFQEQLKSKPYA